MNEVHLLQAEILGGTLVVVLLIGTLWWWLHRRDSLLQEKLDEHHLATHATLDEIAVKALGAEIKSDEQYREARAAAGYVREMVEGGRRDIANAAEGIRTAQHASNEAAELRGDKAQDALKGFQLTIWQQFAQFLKTKFNNKKDGS